MTQYIDKSVLVAEIKKKIRTEQGYSSGDAECGYRDCAGEILSFLNTLEVKEDGDSYLEKFKSLQHINKSINKTLQYWGYAPNLYYFDGSWYVDWISCEEGDSIKSFTGCTAEEAINEAYNWFHSTFCNG